MEKRYLYADETGADLKGKASYSGQVFIVAVPTFTSEVDRDNLRIICEQAEVTSGKNKFKWGKSRQEPRLKYMRLILNNPEFKGCLRFSVFRDCNDFDAATVDAIARAARWEAPDEYTSMVYVDALSKTKRAEYMRDLRRMDIPVNKLRGIAKDENEALIRLADAIAGFIRDILTGELDLDDQVKALYEKGLRIGALVDL